MAEEHRPSPVRRWALGLFLVVFALATWALAEVLDYGRVMLADPAPQAAWGMLRSLVLLVGTLAVLGFFVYLAERMRGGLKVRVRPFEALIGWWERKRGSS